MFRFLARDNAKHSDKEKSLEALMRVVILQEDEHGSFHVHLNNNYRCYLHPVWYSHVFSVIQNIAELL